MDNTPVLKVKNLGIDFGGLTAVNRFSIEVDKHQIVGLIGPNGAGKTTVFNMLTKVYQPSRGKIELNGKDITNMSTVEVNKAGIARTFQNIRLFDKLTVLDNVLIGMHNSINYSSLEGIFKNANYRKQENESKQRALELLKMLNLLTYKDNIAGSLPYGAQRRLEICRALATSPSLLLLDEPAAGMNPSETMDLMKTIKDIRDHFNISILLIEHDMKFVMGICEKITVLNYGTTLAVGSPEEIKSNPEVIKAYLGGE